MKGLLSLFLASLLLLVMMGCGGGGSSSPAPFRFTATPSVTAPWQTSANFDLTITNASKDLAGSNVAVTASGLPEGATPNLGSISTMNADGRASGQLSVLLSDQVAPGTYPFTITARLGKTSQTVKATLVVTSVDPSVEIVPNGVASGTMAGLSTTVLISIRLHPGSASAPGADNVVTFESGGKVRPGFTLSFSPNPVTATVNGQLVTLTVQTADTVGAQLYTFDVIAHVNGQNISVPVKVQVRPRTILALTGANSFTTPTGGAGGAYPMALQLVSGPLFQVDVSVKTDKILPPGYRVQIEGPEPLTPTTEGAPFDVRVKGPEGGATQTFGMTIHAEAGQASIDKHVDVTVTGS